MTPTDPPVLWRPSDADVSQANVTRFIGWLAADGRRELDGWEELWRWSVDDLESFWSAVWDFYGVRADARPEAMLGGGAMPGTRWFDGARLNYAQHVLERAPAQGPALFAVAEGEEPRPWTRDQLHGQVGALSAQLRELGVAPGDRVAAYLPNVPEAVVALLATAAIGAVWSACGPELGVTSVVDRFGQIEPKVLLAADGHRFAGREHRREDVVAELRRRLPSVRATILVRLLRPHAEPPPGVLAFDEVVAVPREPTFTAVPADHPLWVLYSSGTTGPPKGIVQGHGGILMEHLKALGLCLDLGPRDTWSFTCSTSWMAWNLLVGGLLHGTTIVLASGSPSHPVADGAFAVAAATGATAMGMGSAYVTACQKAGVEPQARRDVSALRLLIPTGSPLPPSGWRWLAERFDARIDSICGGTDVCTVFFCGNVLSEVRLGEITGRSLAVRAEAWDRAGRPETEAVGEMVVTRPMPSMPLFLWGDPDGRRYHDAYFSTYPGAWRQGDWIEINRRGGVVVSGRSDATLNRGGVRLGSAELYAIIEQEPDVLDSLVIGAELVDGAYLLVAFVVLAEGGEVDAALRTRLSSRLREALSARHVPDDIVAVPVIPRTMTGKKLEVPVKRILQGADPESVVAQGAVDHPEALAWFAAWTASRAPVAAP